MHYVVCRFVHGALRKHIDIVIIVHRSIMSYSFLLFHVVLRNIRCKPLLLHYDVACYTMPYHTIFEHNFYVVRCCTTTETHHETLYLCVIIFPSRPAEAARLVALTGCILYAHGI